MKRHDDREAISCLEVGLCLEVRLREMTTNTCLEMGHSLEVRLRCFTEVSIGIMAVPRGGVVSRGEVEGLDHDDMLGSGV